MSSGKIVVLADRPSASYTSAIVGDISGTTIAWGTLSYFSANGRASYVAGCRISDTVLVAAFCDLGSSNRGSASVGTISNGNSVSFGATSQFFTSQTEMVSVAYAGSDKFIVGFRDAVSSYSGRLIVGNITGTSVSGWGLETPVTTGPCYDINVVNVISSKILVQSESFELGHHAILSAIATVSGATTISLGEPTEIVAVYGDKGSPIVLSSVAGVIPHLNTNTIGKAPVIHIDTNNSTVTANKFPQIHYENVAGVVSTNCASGATATIQLDGVVGDQTGLTVGAVYYLDAAYNLSTTPTALTPASISKPAEAKEVRIGLALSSTQLLLGIDYI
jgi:hypothetical protein